MAKKKKKTKKIEKKLVKARYIAYLAASIDGRIAKNKSSEVDWTSREDWSFFQKSLTRADAIIVGSNTFNTVKDRLQKRNTIVLTSKVTKPKIEGSVTFLNPKKSNLKKFVESKNYREVAVVGGGKVYDFCLRNKMIYELFVTIEPYVFTAGIPMFAGNSFKKHKFKLESVKKLNKAGTLLLRYKNGN